MRLEDVSRACGCTLEPRIRRKRHSAVREALRVGWSEDELELALLGALDDGWALERGVDVVAHAARNPEGYIERGRRRREEERAAEGEKAKALSMEAMRIRKCEERHGPHTRARLECGEEFAFCIHCEFTMRVDALPENSDARVEDVEERARAPEKRRGEFPREPGKTPSALNACLNKPNLTSSERSSPPRERELVDVREKLPELLRALGVKPRCG